MPLDLVAMIHISEIGNSNDWQTGRLEDEIGLAQFFVEQMSIHLPFYLV
jgi:hypothetical protein